MPTILLPAKLEGQCVRNQTNKHLPLPRNIGESDEERGVEGTQASNLEEKEGEPQGEGNLHVPISEVRQPIEKLASSGLSPPINVPSIPALW